HRNGALHVALAIGVRLTRRRTVRFAGPPPRRARPHVYGTDGLHSPPQVHLHRRAHRRDHVLGKLSRGSAVQRFADHPRLVLVLRADGSARTKLSERPEHAKDPWHQGPAEIRPPTCAPVRTLPFTNDECRLYS